MSHTVFVTKFRNGKKISSYHIFSAGQSEVIERLLGLSAHSYIDNAQIHDAIQTDTFKQNWLKFQARSLRQIQLHADDLLAEFEDLVADQTNMISELKPHINKFTVGDIKKYNERLTHFSQCPLGESEIVLNNRGLKGNDVALVLDFVGDLIREPKNVEVDIC